MWVIIKSILVNKKTFNKKISCDLYFNYEEVYYKYIKAC
jgi:hypothetical protein